MKKQIIFIYCALLPISALAFAHDGGHGPKLTDAAKQGGVVSPVIDAKDASKGPTAAMVYKAELVRAEDGTARLYLYDKGMNPLGPEKFDGVVTAIVESVKKKKVIKTPFTMNFEEGAFKGKAPQAASRPFNIDVRLKEIGKTGRDLMAAFDNLD